LEACAPLCQVKRRAVYSYCGRMKTQRTATAAVLLVCLLLPACSEQTRKEKGTRIREAVDTVIIQRPKIEAGVRAGRKIRRISAEHQKDLEAALGE